MEHLSERRCESNSYFANLYKYNERTMELSQQQRREKFLKEQKEKRHHITDQNREICEALIKDMGINDEKMECESVKLVGDKKVKFKLMRSEWFTDIPDDLEENWLVKLCPEGFRILLVARNHQTICYNLQGRCILKMRTPFPGGGGNDSNGVTVLDCIYNKNTKVIFVLDCLFWNSMSTLDSEVNFRFFWLKTKFKEDPDLKNCKKYSFILLDCMLAQRSLIQDKMFQLFPVENHMLPYDGIVFYHKESHYTFGYTPLVGWLASYMLPEKLHIDVLPGNMARKPKDYVCLENYLVELCKKKKCRKSNEKTHLKENSEMDMQ